MAEEKTEITDITEMITETESTEDTGGYKRLKDTDAKKITADVNQVLPSAQDKIEAGASTSLFEKREKYLAAKSTVTNLKTERATMAIESATNIATNAIDSALVATAGWEAIKQNYTKENLQELWSSIKELTVEQVKQYGIDKVTQITADIPALAGESVSYLGTRTAYWTSYCTAEALSELNLSKIMSSEETKLVSKIDLAKAQKKAADLSQTQEKFTNTINQVNSKVNQITGLIQGGITYIAEGPDLLLTFIDTTMDTGMSEVDKYYRQGYNEAKDFIFNETDKLASAAGRILSENIAQPIRISLQETMNKIFIMKAAAVTKASAAVAVAISKIAALIGL